MRFFRAAAFAFPLCVALAQQDPATVKRGFTIEASDHIFRLENDGTSVATHVIRRHLLSNAGRSAVASVALSYDPATQKLEIEYCRILKPDGTAVAVDPSKAIETSVREGNLVFTTQKQRKLEVPGVEVGDAVEYRYVNRSTKPNKPGDFWRLFYRNQTAEAESVVLDLPEGRKVVFRNDLAFPFDRQIAGGRTVYRWSLKKVQSPAAKPASDEEVTIPPPLFAVSTLLTWNDVGEWLDSFSGPRAAITPPVQELADRLTPDKLTPRDKVQAIYTYVSNSIRYLSLNFEEFGGLQPHFAEETLKNGYGDCKDHSTLMIALLKAVGIRAFEISITPGVGVPVPDVPIPNQFSHAITMVELGGQRLWLDTTPRLAPMELLINMRGKQAHVSEPGKSRLETIPSASPLADMFHVVIQSRLDKDGKLSTDKRVDAGGWFDYLLRSQFANGLNSGAALLPASGGIEGPGNGDLSAPTSSTPTDLSQPFYAARSNVTANFMEPGEKEKQLRVRQQDFLAMAPNHSAILLAKITGGRLDRQEKVELDLDPVYTVDLPLPVKVSRSFGTYQSTYSFDHGKLLIERKLAITDPPALLKSRREWQSLSETINQDRDQVFLLHRSSGGTPVVTPSTENLSVARLFSDANKAYDAGRFGPARDLYVQLVAKDPKYENAWRMLGLTYYDLKQFSAAEEAYKRELANHPDERYLNRNLGQTYLAETRFEDAAKCLEKEIELYPLATLVRSELGLTYLFLGRWDEAGRVFADAAKVLPKDASIQVHIGRVLLHQGRNEEARAHFTRALELDASPGVHEQVAHAMADSSFDLPQARVYADRSLSATYDKLCPVTTFTTSDNCRDWELFLGRVLSTTGWVLFQQGDPNAAEPYLVAGHRLRRESAILERLGLLRLHQGKRDEAIQLYAEAIRARGYMGFPPDRLKAELEKSMSASDLVHAVAEVAPVTFRIAAGALSSHLEPGEKPITIKFRAVVGDDGKIEQLERVSGPETTASEAMDELRHLQLPPIAWPGRNLRTVRIVEVTYGPEQKVEASWTVGHNANAPGS